LLETQLKTNGETIDVWEAKLRARHGQNLQVVYWHWLAGRYTINPYLSKLYEAKAKLFGQARDGAVIMLVTAVADDAEGTQEVLQQFSNDMLPKIQQQLNAIAN